MASDTSVAQTTLTPAQQVIVERAEQACRYVLKHQDFTRDEPGKPSDYEAGFADACKICEEAIRGHVLRHLAEDAANGG